MATASPRGAKHGRSASSVSPEPKRLRDDVSVMSVEPDFAPPHTTNQRIRKRTSDDERRTEDEDDGEDERTALSSVADADDSVTELDTDDYVRRSKGKGKATRVSDEHDDELADDIAWLAEQQANSTPRKGKSKVARTAAVDSPSQRKRRVRKGNADPYITSPPGTKARGKRAADESDDHEIGQQWTDWSGLRWRMGDDGQARREAVVQEMRLKYPNMPRDSRHPDAKVRVPVLVERWLTKEEYEEKRLAKQLGFQDEERQRDIDEAEAKRKREAEEREEERRKEIAQSGRPITTPKKLRNVEALFAGSTPAAARQSSPASSRPSPAAPYKRLSLSMGSGKELDNKAARDDNKATPEPKPAPMSAPASEVRKGSTPRRQPPASSTQPPPSRFASPAKSAAASSPKASPAQAAPAPSAFSRLLGSLGAIVTRRSKREESLHRLVSDEADRRKERGTSEVK